MTAAIVRTRVLDPAMEAQAHNARQKYLVANPSPECDSLIEHYTEIVRLSTSRQRPHLQAVLELLRELADSNAVEGQCEQQIAGVADQIATDMRNAELNGAGGNEWTAKSIARLLRDPLADLLSPVITGDRRDRAVVMAITVIARAPRAVLLSDTVRYQLGDRKYAQLETLAAQVTS